jgi:hypothetical protein
MVNHPNRSKHSVQDVQIGQKPSGAWEWSYRLGNKIIMGSVWRAGHTTGQQQAEQALDTHLSERGLSR